MLEGGYLYLLKDSPKPQNLFFLTWQEELWSFYPDRIM